MASARVAALVASAALLVQSMPASAQRAVSYCSAYQVPNSLFTPGFSGPMTYKKIKSRGGTILLAEGGIRTGESQRLEQAITQAGAIDEIWLSSPGGAALEGPLMGRVIRKRGIAVRLPKGMACISACTYAFLGGPVRIVEDGSYYAVHMFTSESDVAQIINLVEGISQANAARLREIQSGRNKAEADAAVGIAVRDYLRSIEQRSAVLAAAQARYLVEMSLSLDFMTDIFSTKAEQVCVLSRAGLQRYNVANAG